MADTKTADQDQDQDQDQDGKGALGRVLDVAGVFAAVLLGVIIYDVLSGGKVTRVLSRKRPCEGCAEKTVPQDRETNVD